MLAAYALIGGLWVLFATSAVWALVWALQRGEFRDPSDAALSIFDDHEPVGEMTDRFPDQRAQSGGAGD